MHFGAFTCAGLHSENGAGGAKRDSLKFRGGKGYHVVCKYNNPLVKV